MPIGLFGKTVNQSLQALLECNENMKNQTIYIETAIPRMEP